MQSAAFVVGPRDGVGEALIQLGQEVGFQSVSYFTGAQPVLTQMRKTPVCFFLVSSSVPKSQISEFVTEIRLHRDANLKYAPMLYLSEDPSPRTISFCMQSGFDDIVAPPFTAPRLLDRLKGQLGSTKIYCRTDTYFGPDRRRMEKPGDKVSDRRVADNQCEILQVRRDLRVGINVIKRRTPAIVKQTLQDLPARATPPGAPPHAMPQLSDDMMLID